MGKKYAHLLAPLRIGDTVVKNRMLYPNASPHFLQGPETFPAEGYRAFVAGLAKNGAGMITLAEWDNYPAQRQGPADADFTHMQAFDLSDPSVSNYFSALAEEVHFYGAKLLLSTDIHFPWGYSLNGGPRQGPPGSGPDTTEPIPVEMIPQVVDAFVQKVKQYRDWGYDGVTMRIENHLHPSENPRNDQYGGSLENRTRLLLECYAAVKKALGKGFITEAQLAGEQPLGYTGERQNGYTLADTVAFSHLAAGKIDILQLREKDMTLSHPTGFTFEKGQHETIRYAEAVKAGGADILVEPIGGFQDPDELEGYLAAGKCDLFGMARAFICDFDYGEKLREGRGEDVTPCLWCNKCHGTIRTPPDPWVSVCSVNPRMGLQHVEHRLVPPAGKGKKVAVIGGGPAGMRAAIVAAERGHSVTLFEKTGYLGGQLYHAESFRFKWPIRDFKNWLVRQMEKAGVSVCLNCAPTSEEVAKIGFDAVIAATGAQAQLPASIQGLRDAAGKALYPTCADIFGKADSLGRHVAIVGGSETGIETAMYLAENGHEVTVLTRQDEIGHDCSKLHYITMAWVKVEPDGKGHMAPAWEKYENIHGIAGVTTQSVEGGRVTYVDRAGQRHVLEADSVVICGGVKPRLDEAMAYAGAADEFYLVGDCNGAGNIQKCMRQAWSTALRL